MNIIGRVTSSAVKAASYPGALRAVLVRRFLRSLPPRLRLCPYKTQIDIGAVVRPNYGYSMYVAADLARKLGHKTLSVIEFGVAGGNGLIAIERHAKEIAAELPMNFEVYGFDTGSGLPPPDDYRDLPYHWKSGFYKMDLEALKSRLKSAQLVIGDVRETCRDFCSRFGPAPIGCIFFDLDFYSSTKAALEIFNADQRFFLPRVFLYFDDIIGGETELYNEFTGQRLAISEFNQKSDHRKITPCHYLTSTPMAQSWHHQIFVYHDFRHPLYNTFVSKENQQYPVSR